MTQGNGGGFISALITRGDRFGGGKTQDSSPSGEELDLINAVCSIELGLGLPLNFFGLLKLKYWVMCCSVGGNQSVCENNPAVQNDSMSFPRQTSCLSN